MSPLCMQAKPQTILKSCDCWNICPGKSFYYLYIKQYPRPSLPCPTWANNSLYMEIILCLISKWPLLAVVDLEGALFSLAFLCVFLCVCTSTLMHERRAQCMIKANIWKGCSGVLKPTCMGLSCSCGKDSVYHPNEKNGNKTTVA